MSKDEVKNVIKEMFEDYILEVRIELNSTYNDHCGS